MFVERHEGSTCSTYYVLCGGMLNKKGRKKNLAHSCTFISLILLKYFKLSLMALFIIVSHCVQLQDRVTLCLSYSVYIFYICNKEIKSDYTIGYHINTVILP